MREGVNAADQAGLPPRLSGLVRPLVQSGDTTQRVAGFCHAKSYEFALIGTNAIAMDSQSATN
jgi:hypothetical protein